MPRRKKRRPTATEKADARVATRAVVCAFLKTSPTLKPRELARLTRDVNGALLGKPVKR